MENGNQTRQFEDAFERIVTSESVEAAVFSFRDVYDVINVTLHMAQTVSDDVDMPYVRSTYPPEWISRYLMKGYVNVDPVVAEGFKRQLPFDWTDIELTQEAMELFQDSQKYGLGASGYSIPVIDKSGRRSLLTVNAAVTGEEWEDLTEKHKQHWAELAHRLHKRAITEIYGDDDPAPQLGPRERECLFWVARGKDYKDISIILGISEHTTRGYLKSARYKLDCSNLSQAVSKAIKLRMIKPSD